MGLLDAATSVISNAVGRVVAGVDWAAVRRKKRTILGMLAITPPGAGISIDDTGDPVVQRALIEILRDNPRGIEITDFGFSCTLMRKFDMESTVGDRSSYEQLVARYDVLTADNMLRLDMLDGHELPNRRWRGGVPKDVNDGDPFGSDDRLLSDQRVHLVGPDGRPLDRKE